MGHNCQNLIRPGHQSAGRLAWLLLACSLFMDLGKAQVHPLSSDAKPALEVAVQVRPPGRYQRNAYGAYQFISEVSALGVRVEVCEHPIGPEVRILATYKTDDRGNVSIRVPAEGYSKQPQNNAAVTLRVQHDGYQTRYVTNLHRREPGAKGRYTTGFNLIPGRTVLGRVRGPDGKACSAKVEYRTEGPSVVVKPVFEKGCCTGCIPPSQGVQGLGQGAFAFHYEQDLQADFLATAKDVGCGALLGVNLAIDSPHNDLRITIGGPGVLRGRLVDGNGNPLGSMLIDCAPAAGEEAHARAGWICQNWSVRTPGNLNPHIRTDAQGRFEAKGLRVGAYRLSIPGGNYARQAGSFDLLHEADGQEIKLVATPGEIRIKLLDVGGQPLEGHTCYFELPRFGNQAPTYQSPVLVVSTSVPTPWGPVPGERIRTRFDSESGDNVARVTSGRSYFIRV
ncbi:MAG: hypothetical protein GY930_08390 [bacterium]|nr:hypothetical protein [bacterium]